MKTSNIFFHRLISLFILLLMVAPVNQSAGQVIQTTDAKVKNDGSPQSHELCFGLKTLCIRDGIWQEVCCGIKTVKDPTGRYDYITQYELCFTIDGMTAQDILLKMKEKIDTKCIGDFSAWITGDKLYFSGIGICKEAFILYKVTKVGEFFKILKRPPTLASSDDSLWSKLWNVDPLFSLSGIASGVSHDTINPGKVIIGTSTFTATVYTQPGQSSYQILNEAKNQLIAGGVQNVVLFPMDIHSTIYGLSFKVEPLDTLVTFGSDDYGIDYFEFQMRDSSDLDTLNQTITGPQYVLANTSQIYSVSPPASCGSWDILTNNHGAMIEWSNDSTVSVFTGRDSCFNLYYNTCSHCWYTIDRKVICVDDPSPVELSSFSANVKGRDVLLDWTTSSELNNQGFKIERALQNGEFIVIGSVDGKGTVQGVSNYNFEDKNLTTGRYDYRLKQIDFNGNFKYYDLQNEVVVGVPDKFSLYQNYPNPFNPVTKIRFDIAVSGNVDLRIYDNAGREVKTIVNAFKEAGYYTVEFNGSDCASGVYYYRIETDGNVDTKKMVILK